MGKSFLLLFAVVCSPAVLFAQKVRTVSATEQSWSGGVAGKWGTSYNFVIEFTGFKKDEPLPDTIWIDRQPVVISITDSNYKAGINTKRIRTRSSVRFEISAGTSHDDNSERYTPYKQNEKKSVSAPPIPYGGVALLSYKHRGREHYYEITKILNRLPPINYP